MTATKRTLVQGLLVAAVSGLLAGVALAKTPDGETPAEESVCDALQQDGVTAGLYGLCVAFCEAQDWDDMSCMDDGDPLDCGPGKSAGKLLENYDNKKTSSDPNMPCIVSGSECPCWNAVEFCGEPGVNCFQAGLDADWSTLDELFLYGPAECVERDICQNGDTSPRTGVFDVAQCADQIVPNVGDESIFEMAHVAVGYTGFTYVCQGQRRDLTDRVSVSAVITEETYEACRDELLAIPGFPQDEGDNETCGLD
jgi:hypothetical protein